MKITLRLVSFTVGFTALALTEALAQSPEIPEAPIIQLLGTFDYPGTGNQTRPQKINDVGDVVGIFVDASGASRGFVKFSDGNFSTPIVDPNDAGNLTEARGINGDRRVCGDYLDATLGTFHGFFFTHGSYRNYDVPDSTTTIVLGLNNVRDFAGSVTPTLVRPGGGTIDCVGVTADRTLAGFARLRGRPPDPEDSMSSCAHLVELPSDVEPSTTAGCEDCLRIGGSWVHLRLCMTCGHVGCCDSSKNKHATKHFHAINHPIIKSFQPGEGSPSGGLLQSASQRCCWEA